MIFRRLEFKYFIDVSQRPLVRRLISPYVERDGYSDRNTGNYTVESLYFDDLSLTEYRLKVDGFMARSKIRIRSYPGTTARFIERKSRQGLIVTKERVRIPDSVSPIANEWFTARAREALPPESLSVWDKIASRALLRRMRPVVGIRYEREAYISRFQDHLRINIDMGLSATPNDIYSGRPRWRSAAPPAQAILEIKSRSFLPGWLRGLIRECHLAPRAISKYCHATVATRRAGERAPT